MFFCLTVITHTGLHAPALFQIQLFIVSCALVLCLPPWGSSPVGLSSRLAPGHSPLFLAMSLFLATTLMSQVHLVLCVPQNSHSSKSLGFFQ